MNQDVVTFKSSWCRPRYFKNCIGRKCESSSIPTSTKLRWGVETRPPGVEFWPEVGGRQGEVGGSTPNPRQFEHWSDVRESMNRVKNGGFLVRKWSYTAFNIVNIRKMWEKKGKIRRTKSMTKKKGHQKFLPWKWTFFLKLGREKIFLSPPNSAPGLRPCVLVEFCVSFVVTF